MATGKLTKMNKNIIATGVGYKNPRMKGGKLIGVRYEYPITTKEHLILVKKVGGEVIEK